MAEPGDEFEVPLEGFVIDIRRGTQLLEIQTSSFGAMGRKLDRLLSDHEITLIHPIALETYLHKPGAKPRRSPIKGDLYSILDELVSIPTLVDHPKLTIEVVFTVVDKFQEHDPKARRGRGGWRTVDKKLRSVESHHYFRSAGDVLDLLPVDLPSQFTTADIAGSSAMSRSSAQKLVYCLKALGSITLTDRTRSGYVYVRA